MKASKKLLALLLALVLVVAMTVPALAAEDGIMLISANPEDMTGKIVILHTNDVHGGIEGYAKIAALKAEYEAAGASVLLMDAGDFSQGETCVSVSEGATAIELMNMVGYDVAAPGNHEFDYGYANLKELEAAANFPILAANVKYGDGSAFGDHIVLTAGEKRIGVFGLDTPETATKAHPAKIAGVTFVGGTEMYALAQAEVNTLKAEGCDYIICLGHLGIDNESAVNGNRSVDLLANVNGIDVFIDGHSHSTLETVLAHESVVDGKVGDTLITSTGAKLAYVGVVILDGENIAIESAESENITVAENDAIAARAQAIRAEIEAEYGATFATSSVKLNGDRAPGNRTEETNLGNLITDAMVWYATKDGGLDVDEAHIVAVTNGGGIRAAIEIGDISKNSVNAVLPFGNTVAIVYVTGEQLLEALEASTFCTPTAVGGFPQIGGMNITLDTTKEFDQGDLYPGTTYYAPASINRVTVDSVHGNAFSLTDTYAVVSNDFCAAGGDTYYAFSTATVMDTGTPLDVAVMEYVTNVLGGIVGAQYAEPAGHIRILTEADLPLAYTVRYGDTMGSIALNYYGSAALHTNLYRANAAAFAKTGGRLNTGMTLILPAQLGSATRLAERELGEGETAYAVKAGDSLSLIAKNQYGDATQWKAIYEANKDVIKNPNVIYVGQILVLPELIGG